MSEVCVERWSIDKGKGRDDVFASGGTVELLEGEAAEKWLAGLEVETGSDTEKAKPVTVGEFLATYPSKRPPVIANLLRLGETMNIIGAAKAGKSWLILSLLLCIASGQKWLGRSVAKGKVLLVDNELHPEELSSRLGRAMQAMQLDQEHIGDRLEILSLRGQLSDIHTLAAQLQGFKDRGFTLIALDAFYRFLPEGTSENDNAQMAAMYNTIDALAGFLGCAIVLNHHASKGDQSGKSITDVGSGAGSISRAADSHLIIRPHELDGHAVLEGVCRSFPPVEPATVRFSWPLWSVADIEPRIKRMSPGGSDSERRDRESDEAVIALIEADGPATKWQIRTATKWGQSRVDRTVKRLLEVKKIGSREKTDPDTKKTADEFFLIEAKK